MKKQLLLFALLSVAATHINASRRVFKLADPEGRTERYNENFNTYKNNVIEAINNSIEVDHEPADTIYKAKDLNYNPKDTSLNKLLSEARVAADEGTLEAVDVHYQNTLYVIHQHD
ncbi:hypothetical protein K9K77_02545 [Candidatus Babeliales bacterium]|nr:hypothetical protein [Candidatus Babeliales bacterium]